ncbi:3'-5' exonuclease [Legionella sp. PATHC038]|uniref:3'-5' exonuclease n=1 Tax=Legionella sheltonii TaxID=2992041 RepID=UPI0022442721|nr:3'-5' exonuclease [Legionella sp. PATHC038]MCW8399320.1 3'-5' exonuclease [Legionella sp. PATHC038]
MIEQSFNELSRHPDYQVLKRVPMELKETCAGPSSKVFMTTIIDLETMGMDATQHEIIEIGMLSFSFSNEDGILAVKYTYNELSDPCKPIPSEITKITGITDEDVKGKVIDWGFVSRILNESHLIICHNSQFDRNFLELQTPEDVQKKIISLPFACTIKDIQWKERKYESSKLDYLNWKLGYFYDGHRAINDCWATLNLLLHETGAFDELKANVRKKQTLICAENAPFDKKDLLKSRHYRWSDGTAKLPKSWWTIVDNDALDDEKAWLDTEIFGRDGKSSSLPQSEITARNRYSIRAELLK